MMNKRAIDRPGKLRAGYTAKPRHDSVNPNFHNPRPKGAVLESERRRAEREADRKAIEANGSLLIKSGPLMDAKDMDFGGQSEPTKPRQRSKK